MTANRRKLVRRSFMAVVTGTSALALQACSGDAEQGSAGNNSAQQEKSEGESASDSGDSGS